MDVHGGFSLSVKGSESLQHHRPIQHLRDERRLRVFEPERPRQREFQVTMEMGAPTMATFPPFGPTTGLEIATRVRRIHVA